MVFSAFGVLSLEALPCQILVCHCFRTSPIHASFYYSLLYMTDFKPLLAVSSSGSSLFVTLFRADCPTVSLHSVSFRLTTGSMCFIVATAQSCRVSWVMSLKTGTPSLAAFLFMLMPAQGMNTALENAGETWRNEFVTDATVPLMLEKKVNYYKPGIRFNKYFDIIVYIFMLGSC